MLDKITGYVKNNLSQGIPRETIEANLLQSGWAKDQINQTFEKLSHTSTPVDQKPKRSVLKIFVIGFTIIITLIILAIIGFLISAFFSLKPGENNSDRIGSPGLVFVEDNRFYVGDRGRVFDSGVGTVQQTPPAIWVYELPSGRFINKSVQGSKEYESNLKIIEKYHNVNWWKVTPLPSGGATSTYGATSSATNKTYLVSGEIVEGKGSIGYIEVYSPKNKKIKELPYEVELIFNGPDGYIYIGAKEETGVFLHKLDPHTDKVVLKKKFPIKEPSLGIQIDYLPFISEEGIYLLPHAYRAGRPVTQVLIYDFDREDFITFNLDGNYNRIFASGENLYLSGEGGVVWVDRNSGEIVKEFTGK